MFRDVPQKIAVAYDVKNAFVYYRGGKNTN